MKTIIILVLAAALVAGAFLSKPSQDSFVTYMQAQSAAQPQSVKDVGKTILGNIIGDAKAKTLVYSDHVLWVTENLNGQTQYVGAFGHWWKKNNAPPT